MVDSEDAAVVGHEEVKFPEGFVRAQSCTACGEVGQVFVNCGLVIDGRCGDGVVDDNDVAVEVNVGGIVPVLEAAGVAEHEA